MNNNIKWLCKKCNILIDNCIDIDYHNDTVHPDFSDKFIIFGRICNFLIKLRFYLYF